MNRTWKILLILNLILVTLSGSLYGITRVMINTEDVLFYSSLPDAWQQIDTNITLHGRFYYPQRFNASNQYHTLIMFHGLTGNLENNDHFARILAQNQILCFSIDFRGHGQSTGSFPFENGLLYNATFGDVMGVYRYLQNLSYFNASKAAVLGMSLGGGAALYMALTGLIPKFVLWYPGTAYIWGSSPLYQHNATSSGFAGLIFVGTADECVRCKPEYVTQFASRHATVQVYWLEGATHGDSRFYDETVEVSTQYLLNLWELGSPTWWQTANQNGGISLFIVGILIAMNLGLLLRHWYQKRKLKHSKTLIQN